MRNENSGAKKRSPNDSGESPGRPGDDRDRADRPTGHASLPDADTAENRNGGRIGLGRRPGRIEGADADNGVLLTDGGHTQSPESRLREALKQVQIAREDLPSEVNLSGITTTLNRVEVNIRGVADALEQRSGRERTGRSQTIAGPGDETEPITDGGKTVDEIVDVGVLRGSLHDDIEIVHDDGDMLRGPGGTRLVRGQRYDPDTWIDRRSKWGNPFELKEDGGDYKRRRSVELYEGWFHGHVERGEWNPEELRGQTLGCWCLPELCHGVVILNFLAETYEPQQTLATDGGRDRECPECERLLVYRGECAGCGWTEEETDEIEVATDGGQIVDSGRRSRGESSHIDPENACIECGTEAALRCESCGFPLCGKHHELGGGFCRNFGSIGDVAGCAVGETFYPFSRAPDADEIAVIVPESGDDVEEYHIPAPEADIQYRPTLCEKVGDGLTTLPLSAADGVNLCDACETAAAEWLTTDEDRGEDPNLITDGGTAMSPRQRRREVASAGRRHAGVGGQLTDEPGFECRNGTPGCHGGAGSGLPCAECFSEGGDGT